ncbi:hypothetical protein GCM10027036_37850 [Flavihumibacter cheonanensis]
MLIVTRKVNFAGAIQIPAKTLFYCRDEGITIDEDRMPQKDPAFSRLDAIRRCSGSPVCISSVAVKTDRLFQFHTNPGINKNQFSGSG